MIKLDFDSIHSLSVIIKAKKDSEQSLKGEKRRMGRKQKVMKAKIKYFFFFAPLQTNCLINPNRCEANRKYISTKKKN
jgi:hypothetical protein